jgi:4-amino-4-deoxy-L-arabinose transferase-like glycosyltransferase
MTQRNLFLFLGGWFLINGLQAWLTNLANDEAYYWVYSLRFDWGYFDHPPMVAAFIWLGYYFFENEFGVRLFTLLSQLLAIWLMYRYLLPESIKQQRLSSFIWIVVAMPLIHVFAFIATPDAPLLLAAVLFLIAYKKFLEDNAWGTSLLMGVSMAMMLYAKYHGILIIGFIILSNPSLLINGRFWAGSLFGACLFVPHLLWQFTHEFPSLKYHLVDRNKSFQVSEIGIYLMNQLINFNPVIAGVVAVNLFREKLSKEKFERGLVFLLAGFLLFFLMMNIRGHIEPQWTYVLAVPIIYLVIKYATDRQMKAIITSSFVVLPVLVLGRVALIFDIIPVPNEFHGYPSLVKNIQREANGLPVFILNSYQLTSKYHFYTQERAYGISSGGRHNQYDIWQDEEAFFGKDVFAVRRSPVEGYSHIKNDGFYQGYGRVIHDFHFYKAVRIIWNPQEKLAQTIFSDTLVVDNPYHSAIEFGEKSELLLFLTNDQNKRQEIKLHTRTSVIASEEKISVAVFSEQPLPAGEYSVRFGLRASGQVFSMNSPVYIVAIQ